MSTEPDDLRVGRVEIEPGATDTSALVNLSPVRGATQDGTVERFDLSIRSGGVDVSVRLSEADLAELKDLLETADADE